MNGQASYREAIANYIAREARPVDKYGHQPRLYALAQQVGAGVRYDDDVLYAAAWLHDLGVFEDHRPKDLQALAAWDNVAYAMDCAPAVLRELGFPEEKIHSVVEAIRTHQPAEDPFTLEGVILRDADILEQLGTIGILRMVSKVGRDSRYPRFTDVVSVLKRNLAELPGKLRTETARALAGPKLRIMQEFLRAAEEEGGPALF